MKGFLETKHQVIYDFIYDVACYKKILAKVVENKILRGTYLIKNLNHI
jgi:hypothetical protein